jgi:hypothetical protein
MAHLIEPHLTRPGGLPVPIGGDDWIVVVSQTCDVVAQKIEAEPFVEVLHCRPISKLRRQYKDLRSTRTLDFKPNRDTHDAVMLTAHAIADRYLVPRELLRDRSPDAARRLSPVATTRVLAWYALRYARPAWPDAFVARIRLAGEALEAALEPLKDDVAEVRISIGEKDTELQDGEVYHVAIFFVVDEAIWEGDVDGRVAIYEAFAKFVSEINACEGIEVNQDLSGVFSGASFSWQDTRSSDEWNFANLTHREYS